MNVSNRRESHNLAAGHSLESMLNSRDPSLNDPAIQPINRIVESLAVDAPMSRSFQSISSDVIDSERLLMLVIDKELS